MKKERVGNAWVLLKIFEILNKEGYKIAKKNLEELKREFKKWSLSLLKTRINKN